MFCTIFPWSNALKLSLQTDLKKTDLINTCYYGLKMIKWGIRSGVIQTKIGHGGGGQWQIKRRKTRNRV